MVSGVILALVAACCLIAGRVAPHHRVRHVHPHFVFVSFWKRESGDWHLQHGFVRQRAGLDFERIQSWSMFSSFEDHQFELGVNQNNAHLDAAGVTFNGSLLDRSHDPIWLLSVDGTAKPLVCHSLKTVTSNPDGATMIWLDSIEWKDNVLPQVDPEYAKVNQQMRVPSR